MTKPISTQPRPVPAQGCPCGPACVCSPCHCGTGCNCAAPGAKDKR